MSRIYMQAYVKCICNVGLHEARCIFIVWGFLPFLCYVGLQLVSCEMFLFESSLLSIMVLLGSVLRVMGFHYNRTTEGREKAEIDISGKYIQLLVHLLYMLITAVWLKWPHA